MVETKKIGITGIQGAISEHALLMKQTLLKYNNPGKISIVKSKNDLNSIDALILPGGETTTISKILHESGLLNEIIKKIDQNDLPIMGTCAGCVLLSKQIIDKPNEIHLLNAMKMHVIRNAFGRQKESFEKDIQIKEFDSYYHAVFIRAPIIDKIWDNCKALAKIDNKIIMARQDNLLALSFHPELTDDLRIHKYFLDMI